MKDQIEVLTRLLIEVEKTSDSQLRHNTIEKVFEELDKLPHPFKGCIYFKVEAGDCSLIINHEAMNATFTTKIRQFTYCDVNEKIYIAVVIKSSGMNHEFMNFDYYLDMGELVPQAV